VDKTHANEKTSIPGVSTSHPGQRGGSIEVPFFIGGNKRVVKLEISSWGMLNFLYRQGNCTHALLLINTLNDSQAPFPNGEGGRDKGRDKDLSFSWPLSVKPKDV